MIAERKKINGCLINPHRTHGEYEQKFIQRAVSI